MIGIMLLIMNIDVSKYLKHMEQMKLKEIRGQEMLFYCFLNLFLLHIPSFLWVYQVNLSKCLSLLEHIVHYYFTMALLLLFFTSRLQCKQGNSELMVASQMSFYYLWHIHHKIKDSSNSKCTLYPGFMGLTIYTLIISGIVILFSAKDILKCDSITCGSVLSNDFINIYSAFLASEIASILFQWIEEIYSFLLIKN